MPVYWSMLAVTSFLGIISLYRDRVKIDGIYGIEYKTNYMYAFLSFAYIVFFCSFRDSVLDTEAYINSFNAAPTNWEGLKWYIRLARTGKGFYLIQGIFKICISDNHYAWLAFLAGISSICMLRTLYRYSENFPLSAYLFVANTTFTWLLNGTRQFLAVSILFAFSEWMIKGKRWRYIILAMVLSTLHTSAIFVVPVCLFVSANKIWDKKMILFVLITIIGTRYSERIFSLLNRGLDRDYSSSLAGGTGSTILRLAVAVVPVLIIFIAKRCVEMKADERIYLAANMSLVGACFYFASTFTSGILVGRMPIYFSIYNLYLLPWLIHHCFEKKSKLIVTYFCVMMYLFYFYYQMMIAWSGLPYISEFLHLRY
ncbi:EpsG family protein [Enterocloster bolteae]|uniref:EpsG family protein n=1 Tax=Enterocloster bolteae TaxID=208479 RepID=UPI00189FE2AA|nr:EpsG family protein [Enterocloster bolteae]